MYASQRNSLSPTWHMLLMGLMSVILFFGGLLTSNDRPVPIVDNLPNEGLLRPTSLLPWESVELSETRLLFRHEEMQEVKSPQRLNQPTQHNLLARHHGFQPFASALPTPAFAERILRGMSLYWTYSVCAALAIGCRHSYILRIVWIAKCIYIAGWVPCRSFA